MIRVLPTIIPLLALAWPLSALAAEDCPAITGPLDLNGVVAQALCRNPDSRAAWLSVQTQEARLQQTQAAYYPTVEASASQSHSFGAAGSANTTSARLSANWLLYDFGARGANRRQAERVLEALQMGQENSSQKVMQQAADAYYAWYAADESLNAAKTAEKAAEETLRAAEARQKVGSGTLAEVLQARTAFAQAQLNVIQREGSREVATGTVALTLGLPANQALSLTAPQQPLPEQLLPPAYDGLATALEARHPNLRAQKLTVEAARASRDAVDAQDRPTLSLNASDGLSKQSGSGQGFREAGSVGLSLTVPLFAGGRYYAQEKVAEYQLQQAELEYERLRLNTQNELWVAWQGVRTAAATVAANEALVASAKESHRAALARYKAGLGSLIDTLNTQSALANALQQEAVTRLDWQRARINLIKASGVLNTAALETGTAP